MSDLPPAAARVQEALCAAGSEARVREMPASTRTADDAARACGVAVGAIVKSLVFRAGEAPVLVLTSGANRVDEAALGERLGLRLDRADAAFVREATGFAIGGVPPLGHRARMRVVIDRDLRGHPVLWAAAGTPRAVFPTTADELERLTGGTVAAVA
ncbi:MAG TPA: YbaK/EbsC family protein [Thermohalobaculum sp.]|nr:YbaK/EbsC family protein [Thermohalobaculum sp.]